MTNPLNQFQGSSVCGGQTSNGYVERIEREGFVLVEECLASAEVTALCADIESARNNPQNFSRVESRGNVFAIRNLFAIVPAVVELLQHAVVRALVEPILGPNAFAVRGILFDKTPGANWGLLWHQDLSIPVRLDPGRPCPGDISVSTKAGVPHLDAPAEILQRMLTLRFHLDAVSDQNGALRVIPSSHQRGRLTAATIDELRSQERIVTCSIPAGGVIAMRPLLLHSSMRSIQPHRRRVIHLEFASCSLPKPFDWYERIPISTTCLPS